MKRIRVLVAAVAAILCCGAFAKESSQRNGGSQSARPWFPLGLSIIAPPVQLPSPAHSLFGAIVNIGYGQMTDVAVLDVGLVNNVTENMVGLEVGPVNLAGTCLGVQAGIVNNAGTLCGVQVGAINMTGDLHGLQLGVLNFSSNGGALMFPILNFGF